VCDYQITQVGLSFSYLLYNFAATFLVDFTFKATRSFVFWHMIFVTSAFASGLLVIAVSDVFEANWLVSALEPEAPLAADAVLPSITWSLLLLSILSTAACFLHWRIGISKLYMDTEEERQDGGILLNCLSSDQQNTDC